MNRLAGRRRARRRGGRVGPAVRPVWLREWAHTADRGIEVTAPTLRVLFGRAAWGLFAMVADPATVRVERWTAVRVRAHDRASLLVRWLSELNFLHQTRHELYAAFDVSRVGGGRVAARVGGEAVAPRRHRLRAEVKAVTFHCLRVERRGGVWTARVLFDL